MKMGKATAITIDTSSHPAIINNQVTETRTNQGIDENIKATVATISTDSTAVKFQKTITICNRA